jgi:putative nucleotidyltransferase with HDIG domain
MNRICIFSDSSENAENIRHHLAGMFETRCLDPDRIGDAEPEHFVVVDIDLNDTTSFPDLRTWLLRKPKYGKVLFVTEKGSRLEAVRAHAFGATDLVHRPIDGKAILIKLWGDFDSLAADPSIDLIENSEGAAAAVTALQDIFSSACLGTPLDSTKIDAAGETIVRNIEARGLASWIDAVRKHHSQTYQHCLLVTGLAVSLGRQLGFSNADRQRLSFAGLLHDIGKARVPVDILEKPGPLDKDEMDVMRRHPEFGRDALATVSGLSAEMIDVVAQHHEYLDGSGYPHGLRAGQISDLVRIVTIADIFGALLERRSYKPPYTGAAAYQILRDMGPKLDQDLVRQFRFVSQLRIKVDQTLHA